MSNDVRHGGCRCGKVRFEVDGPPLITLACHCTGCQKMAASAFTLTESYPSAAFRMTEGDVVVGGLHGPTRHLFCDFCKTWVYTEPEGLDFVNVRSTLFEPADPQPPFIDIFMAEALPWARTGATHSYDALPPVDQWPGLMQEYAESRAAVEDSKR